LLGYSRQGFYKHLREEEKEMFFQDMIIEKVLEIRELMPKLGGRKLYFLISGYLQEHSIKLGRDAFFSLLGSRDLLVRIRRRKAITTNSNHPWRRYANLIRDFIPSSIDQLWVADITYIIIDDGFGYLSLITDAFSHKILGFTLSPDLKAEGCIEALQKAITSLKIKPKGLIHHSDRGVQYCCFGYIQVLESEEIAISMTQTGNPKENSVAERVNGILKGELLKTSYPDFEAASQDIAKAVGTYNQFRPHSSIGNLTPNQAHSKEGLIPKKLWKTYYRSAKPAASNV
jgi:putative transposase